MDLNLEKNIGLVGKVWQDHVWLSLSFSALKGLSRQPV